MNKDYVEFKIQRDEKTHTFIVKAYYYTYYLGVFWWKTRDILIFDHHTTAVGWIRENRANDEVYTIIDIPQEHVSYCMRATLGSIRPWTFIDA